MISSIPATIGRRNVFTRIVGRRFRKLGQLRSVAGNCVNDGNDNASLCSHSSTPMGYIRYNAASKRYYSNSLAAAAKDKSGLEHHSLFQEQMLELEKEQQQFGHDPDAEGNDIVGNNIPNAAMPISVDLEDQLSDWKSEQTQVFGEALADHDPTTQNSNTGLDPDEREDRFEFTSEDMVAWGKPNPDASEMQKILQQVALERNKEETYAAQSFVAENKSDTTTTTHHHESFSHVSGDGSSVHMVDVGHKAVTPRTAHARSEVWLPPDVLEAFLPKNNDSNSKELVGPKGPIFATAKIAGIMACKKTSDLIPLCHPLPLDQVQLDISMKEESSSDNTKNGGGTVVIDCTCKVTHKTGVEMEALTGATVAALTIYDMTKAVSHNIRIQETRLMGKTGGKRTVLDGTEKERR